MMGPTEPLASGVITYNGDSERGWNDPPTLSFTTVTASKKGPKNIDLRKRVSHEEALTGRRVTSPLNQNPPNLYKKVDDLSNGVLKLVLGQQLPSQQVPPNVPPPISPCHSRHSSGTYTPPLLPDAKHSNGAYTPPLLPDANSYGMVPPQFPIQATTTNLANVGGPPKIFSSMETKIQPDTGVVHPLIQKSNPIQPPPATTAPPSNLGKPLFSFPSSFNVVPISSVLDTNHVRANPDILPDTSLTSTPPVNCLNTTQVPGLPNSNMVTQRPLLFTPSPTTADSVPPTVGKRSPILNRAYQNGNGPRIYTPPPAINGSGRNSPVVSPALPPTMNKSPISTPPSHSASSTPRSITPDNGYRSENISRHNSEEFDSQEGMKMTIEAIEEIILKCSNILKAREVEDVKKKVGIMKQQWIDEKLSLPVQMTMKSLTKALLDGDTETAHKLHVKLMVEYVGEVKQWMVAIKRLISAMMNVKP